MGAASSLLYNFGEAISPSQALEGLFRGDNTLTIIFSLAALAAALLFRTPPVPRLLSGATGTRRLTTIGCILVGAASGLATSTYQVAVDNGAVLSGIVRYPAGAAMGEYYLGMWTSLGQVTAVLLNLGLSVETASILLCMTFAAIFALSAGVILHAFSQNSLFSIFFAFLLINKLLAGGAMKSPDYPLLMLGSQHSFGVASLAVAAFAVASLFAGWNWTAGTAAGVLVSIHPVLGAYAVGSLLTLVAFNQVPQLRRLAPPLSAGPNALRGLAPGLAIGAAFTVLSFSVFLAIRPDPSVVDRTALQAYLEHWDYHRNQRADFSVLLAGLAFCGLAIGYRRANPRLDQRLVNGLCAITILIVFSSTLYAATHLAPELLPGLILRAAPGRLLNVHASLADAVLLGALASIAFSGARLWPSALGGGGALHSKAATWLQKRLFRVAPSAVATALLGFMAIHALVLAPRFVQDYFAPTDPNAIAAKRPLGDAKFWRDLRSAEIEGMVLNTESTRAAVLRRALKPPLMADIDFIPYLPHTARAVADTLTQGYGVDFFDPPAEQRFRGGLTEDAGQPYLENLDRQGWCRLSEKLNVGAALLPAHWRTSLSPAIRGPEYNAYRLDFCPRNQQG